MKAVSRIALASLGLLTTFSLHSYGQSIFGSLRGLVADSTGAALTGAKVTMIDESTNLSRAGVTNTVGEFSFASVNPATYTLVAEAQGFKKFERKGVIVATQQTVTLDVKMEVGNVTESIMIDTKRPGQEVIEGMFKEKVLIGRVWPVWPTYVRVSIGTPEEMAKFKTAFSKVMGV